MNANAISAKSALDQELAPSRLLREEQVAKLTNIPRRKRRELEAEGKFPSPVRLNTKLVLYVAHEVMTWIESQKATRAEPVPKNKPRNPDGRWNKTRRRRRK